MMTLPAKEALIRSNCSLICSAKSSNRLKNPKYMIYIINIYIYSYIYTSVRLFDDIHTPLLLSGHV